VTSAFIIRCILHFTE